MRISDWSSDVCSSDLLNHPYRIPIIGWDHEIEQLSTEAAIRFYDKWYAPNNTVLIVVGDVDPQRVRALAEKYYGVIPTKDLPERQRVAEPPQNASREVHLESPPVAHPPAATTYLPPTRPQH